MLSLVLVGFLLVEEPEPVEEPSRHDQCVAYANARTTEYIEDLPSTAYRTMIELCLQDQRDMPVCDDYKSLINRMYAMLYKDCLTMEHI